MLTKTSLPNVRIKNQGDPMKSVIALLSLVSVAAFANPAAHTTTTTTETTAPAATTTTEVKKADKKADKKVSKKVETTTTEVKKEAAPATK